MMLYSSEIREPAAAIRELKKYFPIHAAGIYSAEGHLLIDLEARYFYMHDGHTFPITDNVSWWGDYYDVTGSLVCTALQKAVAIRQNRENVENINSFGLYAGALQKAADILSTIVMDYYCSIRSYNVNEMYVGTRSLLGDDYANLLMGDDTGLLDSFIVKCLEIVDNALPNLLSHLSELCNNEENSYMILSADTVGEHFVLRSTGDWRISEWKRMVQSQMEEAVLRQRPTENDKMLDIVEQSKMRHKAPARTVAKPATNYTNFRNL